ncbi:metallophosphoesterase [Aquibacillus koreensis]|uniref:Phosphoesterase n=1 Tax=Aquibacillus koreensis TaxID=279446 RepID=A0A9X3WJP8_9BACI|nr:metallophosphoesterase family protein [Aquibacillus koreensis]MCT2537703.1 metallophosphoesterase [Aquibacillus koreensis]MDC3420950.1 metallophosphoesterase [Aquibacillus koreensis]
MKIVVIADTHIPKRAKKLPKRLLEELKDADLIFHVGDWQTTTVLEELSQYAPVEGVAGNVDPVEIHELFGEKKVFDFEHISIGLTHGDGKSKTTEKRALDHFAFDDVDIIIFGHSHIPVLKVDEGILLFNPGSPTDKRRQAMYSFGVIEIREVVTLKHIFFEDKT